MKSWLPDIWLATMSRNRRMRLRRKKGTNNMSSEVTLSFNVLKAAFGSSRLQLHDWNCSHGLFATRSTRFHEQRCLEQVATFSAPLQGNCWLTLLRCNSTSVWPTPAHIPRYRQRGVYLPGASAATAAFEIFSFACVAQTASVQLT